jgi:hypothetical protein
MILIVGQVTRKSVSVELPTMEKDYDRDLPGSNPKVAGPAEEKTE